MKTRTYIRPLYTFEGLTKEEEQLIESNPYFIAVVKMVDDLSFMRQDVVRFKKLPITTDSFQLRVYKRNNELYTDLNHLGDGKEAELGKNKHYASSKEHNYLSVRKYYVFDKLEVKDITSIFCWFFTDLTRNLLYGISGGFCHKKRPFYCLKDLATKDFKELEDEYNK